MATISDNYQHAAAFWNLDSRIRHHIGSGELLEGLNYRSFGTTKASGVSDMPHFQWHDFSTREEISPGAPRTAQVAEGGNTPVISTHEYTGKLTTNIEDGLVRLDPTDSTQPLGHLEWLSLLLDALEMSTGDTASARLENALIEPMMMEVDFDDVSQAGYTSDVRVICKLQPVCRTERSALFPH